MEKKYLSIGIVALGIVVALGVLLAQEGKVVGADGFGFEKKDVCRIDSCPDAVKGVCEMKEDQGAVMANINDIRSDCDLGRPVTFDEIKSLCADFGPESAVQNVCTSGQCITDADCDDRNPCTLDHCIPTGPRAGCIRGIPIEDGQPCFLDGAVGVCVGTQCTIQCVEVSEEEVQYGACADISRIEEVEGIVLPQCCAVEAPEDCGVDEEWVVGIAAVPVCYIPGS